MPEFNFKEKKNIYSHHQALPFRTLEIDQQKSFQTLGLEDNLIIHGDNLHALKALLPRYEGKIKCIYIDPPYNTGNEGWKYNDNVNSPTIQKWLKQNGIGADDLERHDKWLCMMWPRLQLLRSLLSDDGVIFVSIDDNEQHHLRMIMNEIFGENNFIGSMKRRASRKTAHLSRKMSDMCDYIFAYYKNRLLAPLGVTPVSDSTRPVFNANNSLSKRSIPIGIPAKCQDGFYKQGDYHTSSMQFKLLDDLKIEKGKTVNQIKVEGRFRVNQEILSQTVYITQNFGLRRHLLPEETNKIKALHDLVDDKDFYNEVGSEQVKKIFNEEKKFSNPKPSHLIKFLLKSQEAGIHSKDYIILDSFAGSGTTAHAVLDLNKEDGGNRKFILIECEDYANNITAERIRRVIKKISNQPAQHPPMTQGFTYCTLGPEINGEDIIRAKNLPDYDTLARYVFYTATGETLQTFTPSENFYVGKTKNNCALFLIYKQDKDFLQSNDSALNLTREKAIMDWIKIHDFKKAYVFAMACFVPPEELSQKKIVFCQIPFAIHKLVGL